MLLIEVVTHEYKEAMFCKHLLMECSRKHHLDLEEQIERVVAHAQDIDEFGRFTGLASLKIKETDRIEALKTELAHEIVDELKFHFNTHYGDPKDSIGKRYRRQDAIGTPFCITVDHGSGESGEHSLRLQHRRI